MQIASIRIIRSSFGAMPANPFPCAFNRAASSARSLSVSTGCGDPTGDSGTGIGLTGPSSARTTPKPTSPTASAAMRCMSLRANMVVATPFARTTGADGLAPTPPVRKSNTVPMVRELSWPGMLAETDPTPATSAPATAGTTPRRSRRARSTPLARSSRRRRVPRRGQVRRRLRPACGPARGRARPDHEGDRAGAPVPHRERGIDRPGRGDCRQSRSPGGRPRLLRGALAGQPARRICRATRPATPTSQPPREPAARAASRRVARTRNEAWKASSAAVDPTRRRQMR